MKANKANAADETQGEAQISVFLTGETIPRPTAEPRWRAYFSSWWAHPTPLKSGGSGWNPKPQEIPSSSKTDHNRWETRERRSWMEYGCQERKMASEVRPWTDYPRKTPTTTGFLKPGGTRSTVPDGMSILMLLLCSRNVGSSVSFSTCPLC